MLALKGTFQLLSIYWFIPKVWFTTFAPEAVILFMFIVVFLVIRSSRDYKSFKMRPVWNVGRSYNALLAEFYFKFDSWFEVEICVQNTDYQTKRENFKDFRLPGWDLTQTDCTVCVSFLFTPSVNFIKIIVELGFNHCEYDNKFVGLNNLNICCVSLRDPIFLASYIFSLK